jgi:CRISPR/Cas system-associated exonuclease Cas4 (RecB family)
VHGGVGWNFEQRLGGRQPGIDEAVQVARADLVADACIDDVSSTDLDTLEADATRLVRHYLEQAGDLPVRAVENPFEVVLFDPTTGEALPRRLRGYFDFLTGDGTVVELKTASRGWGDIDPSRHLQLGAYSYAAELATGVPVCVEAHVLVRTKREVRIDRYELASGQHGWWLQSAIEIERAIAARIFPPAPGMACSGCEYRQACNRMGRSEAR